MPIHDTRPRHRRWGRLGGEHGQVLPLVALLLVLALGAALLGTRLGVLIIDRHRAQTAADAAALAAVEGGRYAAERAARVNGGRLEVFVVEPGHPHAGVLVVVRVGEARATAVAGEAPVSGRSPPQT